MKTLNELINDYTCHLRQGKIQVAYKGILEFIGKLRADFMKKYPQYDTGNVYQGYMDMTYFSISTKLLKDKGLKIAIVYSHGKAAFEVWMSARNREISKKYQFVFAGKISDNIFVFHDDSNHDAIMECTLTSEPNFDDQTSLTDIIEEGVEKFITTITSLL